MTGVQPSEVMFPPSIAELLVIEALVGEVIAGGRLSTPLPEAATLIELAPPPLTGILPLYD